MGLDIALLVAKCAMMEKGEGEKQPGQDLNERRSMAIVERRTLSSVRGFAMK